MTLPLPRWVLALLAAAAIIVGVDNMDRRLANPDEGRYSEISREMAQSGDWITPRLNGIKYFEKPPLQYWATAIAFELFGENEFAARLYITLGGLATILIVGYTARRLWDVETALAAMLALVSSPYFLALGGIVTLDMGLTIWTTLSFCCFLLAEAQIRGSESDIPGRGCEAPSIKQPSPKNEYRTLTRKHRRWMLLGWAAMALAVLSKGLVGIVFPVGAVGLHALLKRDLSVLKRLEHRRGIVVFLAIAAPWFVAVSMANPDFAQFFFFHEHLSRFLTRAHRRVEPWWYFLPILFIAGFLPWMFALPAAIGRAWRAERQARFQPLRLAIIWSLLILAFFSASGSKLPTYILPAMPPLALALGYHLRHAAARDLATASGAVTLLAAGVVVWMIVDGWKQLGADPWSWSLTVRAEIWLLAAMLVLCAMGATATALLLREQRWYALVAMAFASVFFIACIVNGYKQLTPRQSAYDVAQVMKPYLKASTRLYSVNTYEQTLPFYLGRTMMLVDYGDEFEAGLLTEKWRVIPETDRFIADWLRPGDALAIIQPAYIRKLKRRGMPMQVLYEDPRRVLIRKP